MKRRDALKNIGLAAGFAAITPSIFSMLQSCTSNTETWTPSYLTSEEKTVVTNLVDIIIPKTPTTPAATEVGVPQFIDNYILEVLKVKDQEITRVAFNKIITLLKPDSESNLDDITQKQYKALLDEHMFLSKEIDP